MLLITRRNTVSRRKIFLLFEPNYHASFWLNAIKISKNAYFIISFRVKEVVWCYVKLFWILGIQLQGVKIIRYRVLETHFNRETWQKM